MLDGSASHDCVYGFDWIYCRSTHPAHESQKMLVTNMTDYRRYRVKGGTYFFTVNLVERKRKLLTEHIDLLGDAFRQVKTKKDQPS